MSITAFDASLIEDLGMQGANDLMDQLPATTRDAYDVRIRGVGRNFRALGGDPGVATYYNGIYSPDFGIAAGESYLYDVDLRYCQNLLNLKARVKYELIN